MSRLLCALCLLAFLPISANAISTASIANTNCSGELTASTLDGASFACTGNLTLDGGFITSDSLINISASGDLFLDNLTLTAPDVTFSNLSGMLAIGSGVVINTSAAIVQNTQNSIVSWSEFNIAQGDVVNFNQGGGSKTVLDKVVGASEIPAGNVSLGDGGSLSLGNSSGIVYSEGNNTPVVGGTLSIGSGSGELANASAVLNEPLLSVAAVPEPTTYAMMLLGLGLISLRRRF